MKYTVVWLPDAEKELATLWLQAGSRSAVADAANWIDRRLEGNPENEGESRPYNRRVHFCKPLGVIFRVFPD